MKLRKKRQAKCTVNRRKFLKLRVLRELVELMVIREATDDERKGRSSGSLTWRMDRGEQGTTNVSR
jgi:peptide-N4-(N-acetyl-beta-glucosaminyl)asparagine amidase